MQKFLFITKYMAKVCLSICVILFIISFPIISAYFKPNEKEKDLFYKEYEEIVLDMWHIESFEGGNLARKTFLDKLSREFNRQNRGVFISLKVMDVEQFSINVNKSTPDIISFTSECKNINQHLVSLPRTNLLSKNYLDSVIYDEDILAYPYMLGRYCLISYTDNAANSLCGEIIERKNKKIFPLGLSSDTQCENVLKNNNLIYNSNAKKYLSQYDNYKGFLKKEVTTILGSQRDVHRLKNREQNGSIENLYYTYLDGYTDLVQYIGVTKNCKNIDVAKKFAEFFLNDFVQTQISKIGMFSVNQKIYTQDYMKEWEDKITVTKIPKLFGADDV